MADWTYLKTVSEKAHPFSECGTCRLFIGAGNEEWADTWKHPDSKHIFVVQTCIRCVSGTTAEQRRVATMRGRGGD